MATENPQTEPEKKSRRFYIILAATILLLALLVGVVLFELSNVGPGPVVIEVTPNKPFYLQGETVSFTIHVNNQQDWPVRYPSTVTYQVEKNSQYIDGDHVEKDCGDPWPKFPAHSKTLYETYQWDQKTGTISNRTFVQPGNYTFTVSFISPEDYGDAGNCTFEIRPNP